MSKFGYLQKLEVSATRVVTYDITEIDPQPKLSLVPATEANKPYFNAVLRRARKNNKSVQAGAVSVNLIEANRDEDRELYAQHIIKGWENVIDDKGKQVPFSPEVCLEYLRALPSDIFDSIREFASNPVNHRDREGLNVEATSKN